MAPEFKPSVVCCCYSFDRIGDTLNAVRSAQAQTLAPAEVVVGVDNNPDLAAHLREMLPDGVLVVENNAVKGLSETRNVALHMTTSDVVAFIDDDAVARPDWLENLAIAFAQPDVVAVGGRSVPCWERGEAPDWFPREFEFEIGCTGHMGFLAGEHGDVRNVTGSNMAFRRFVFESVGEWKRELGRGQVKTGGEEAELCLRIRSSDPGSRIVFESRAIVDHKVSRSRSTLRYVFTYSFNEGIVRAQLGVVASEHTGQPLAGELLFLRRLIDTAIPGRLRRIHHRAARRQLMVILINTALLGCGYLLGRARALTSRVPKA